MSLDKGSAKLRSGPGPSNPSPGEELLANVGEQVGAQGYETPADWDDDEDVDYDGGVDCLEDAQIEGHGAERRAWSRKEDEAITRLVRSRASGIRLSILFSYHLLQQLSTTMKPRSGA